MTEPSVENLRKASTAIYIAVEKIVADDISNLFKWAANEIERLSKPSWECMGHKQSLPEPSECNWPDCGCDPHATKIIESLLEQGWSAPPAPDRAGVREVMQLCWDKISNARQQPDTEDVSAGLILACAIIAREMKRLTPASGDGQTATKLKEPPDGYPLCAEPESGDSAAISGELVLSDELAALRERFLASIGDHIPAEQAKNSFLQLCRDNKFDIIASLRARSAVAPSQGDAGAREIREVLLDMFADAILFEEVTDGDADENGRPMITITYRMEISDTSLKAVMKAVGIKFKHAQGCIEAFEAANEETDAASVPRAKPFDEKWDSTQSLRFAGSKEDRDAVRRQELQEIADGAYGDNPMVRGRAQEYLSREIREIQSSDGGVESKTRKEPSAERGQSLIADGSKSLGVASRPSEGLSTSSDAGALREALEAAKAELRQHDADYKHRTKPGVYPAIDAAIIALAAPDPATGETVAQWVRPIVTIADLVSNLRTLDQTMNVYGAYHLDASSGVEDRCRARGLTLSRERVTNNRIRAGSSENYSLVVWTQPDALASPPAPDRAGVREALEAALPYLETLHSLLPLKTDARKSAFKIVQQARAALTPGSGDGSGA